MTRGLFFADPRVEPADLACGFAFFKLTAVLPEGPCRAGASRVGPADPTHRSENDTKLASTIMEEIWANISGDYFSSFKDPEISMGNKGRPLWLLIFGNFFLIW